MYSGILPDIGDGSHSFNAERRLQLERQQTNLQNAVDTERRRVEGEKQRKNICVEVDYAEDWLPDFRKTKSSGLEPGPLANTPRALRNKSLEASLRQNLGYSLDNVKPLDVACNVALRTQLEKLQVNEYYDDTGRSRCKKIGLAFISTLNATDGKSFGSQVYNNQAILGGKKVQSAKAFIKAQEARLKDVAFGEDLAAEFAMTIDPTQKLRVEHVLKRQVEIIFNEVPDFEKHLPSSVKVAFLQPTEMDRERQVLDRHFFERANALLVEKSWHTATEMGWLFLQTECAVLLRVASLWTASIRPLLLDFGFDRPTFCRFVLDVGLTDPQKAPLFWAMSLFDEASKSLNCSKAEPTNGVPVPASTVVTNWHFACIVDTLLKAQHAQLPRLRQKAEVETFIAGLLSEAQRLLPLSVIQDSGVTDTTIKTLLSGEAEPDDGFSRESSVRDSASPSPLQELQTDTKSRKKSEIPRSPRRLSVRSGAVEEVRQRETIQECLIYALMVEPEVLHLVAQHHDLMRSLHECYCEDGTGSMSYMGLLQFCTDFRLTPAIASSHIVRVVYQSARCLDDPVDTGSVGGSSPSPLPAAPSPASPSPPSRTPRLTTDKRVSSVAPPLIDNLSSVAVPRNLSPLQNRQTSEASSEGKKESSASIRRGSQLPSVGKHDTNAGMRSASSRASQVPSRVSEPPRHRPVAGVFGVGAFIEVLCKIAFTHLELYGNVHQSSTDGFSRMVWLLTYLRSVYSSLHSSMKKRAALHAIAAEAVTSGDGASEETHGLHKGLFDALTGKSSEYWFATASPPPQESLSGFEALARAGLPLVELPIGKNKHKLQQQKELKLDNLRKRSNRATRGAGFARKTSTQQTSTQRSSGMKPMESIRGTSPVQRSKDVRMPSVSLSFSSSRQQSKSGSNTPTMPQSLTDLASPKSMSRYISGCPEMQYSQNVIDTPKGVKVPQEGGTRSESRVEAQKMCPEGHPLRSWKDLDARVTCIVCGAIKSKASTMYGCQQCSYNECENCFVKAKDAGIVDSDDDPDPELVKLMEGKGMRAKKIKEKAGGSSSRLRTPRTPRDNTASKATVAEGGCAGCHQNIEATNGWGYATCHRCSCVDIMDLSQHPLRRLLQDEREGVKRVFAPRVGNGPFHACRAPLTPPTLYASNVLSGGIAVVPPQVPPKVWK